MEIRDFAVRILSATTLDEKLATPEKLTDDFPGDPIIWDSPSRPQSMLFQPHSKNDKLPSFHEHSNPEYRAICLHRFAGHELLAVELMAFALLAFPYAPKHFRKGLVNTLIEEQHHVKLYIDRMKNFNLNFGDLPLYKHFWAYTPFMDSPLKFINVMNLTLEMANLDFAPLYRDSFLRFGDLESAALMQTILEDEFSHVKFGWNWLKKLKNPSKSEWEEWIANLPPVMPPSRAKGFVFYESHRKEAGISTEFIDKFKELTRVKKPK